MAEIQLVAYASQAATARQEVVGKGFCFLSA